MDALVEGHYRAEESGDLEAIVEGFTRDAKHDVVGRPGMRYTAATRSRASTELYSPSFESTSWNPSDAGTATTTSSTSRSCTRPR